MASDPATSGNDLHEALTRTAAALAQRNVPYALIGGMATSHRSQPRFTKDVDFLLKVPQLTLPPLLEDLKARGFEFDTLATIREWTDHHMAVLLFRGIRVDWLKAVVPSYAHIVDRATAESWLDTPVRMRQPKG